jgi:uncharacterized membrane protein YeaQ/YmgE (transglycosylase-associated protein family)
VNIIIWIILGLAMGLIASVIMDVAKTNPRSGTITNVVLGIFGAILGGIVTSFACGLNIMELNADSFIAAIIGAIIIIFLGRGSY